MRALASLLLALIASQALAVDCQTVAFDGDRYTMCTVDASTETMRLFRADAEGLPYGHFSTLEKMLDTQGETLQFAMNAGMYHADRAPVGYYVEGGTEQMRVISNPGPGNFGLLPNGIFCIRARRADVFETRDFLARKPDCRDATQSGPMLVIDGELHPRFLPDSTARDIRNGVGTAKDGKRGGCAISDNAVTFHEFARFFRDGLNLPNALFLDGNISRLYARDLGRNDIGRPMGPIVAVTSPKQ